MSGSGVGLRYWAAVEYVACCWFDCAMATKMITQLVDDLDGTDLADDAGERVEFALDGTTYDIDLSHDHAAQLRETLGSYLAAGRRVNRSQPRRTRAATQPTTGPPAAEVRDWARSAGLDVPATGRIPRSIRDAFDVR